MRRIWVTMALMLAATAAWTETPKQCSISAGHWDGKMEYGKMEFSWSHGDCGDEKHCHEGNSDMPWARWSGIVPEDLQREGAAIDARMKEEAGEMRCVGTIHNGSLHGSYSFTPSEEFARKMEAMGFDGQTYDRLQGYALLDVTTSWVRDMKDSKVTGMTAENLMGLRALKVDTAYVRAMAQQGYPELDAQKLTSMKAVGVSPEKVQAARAMGYSPSEEELIQMSVFKIDAPFVERMKARGFKNLTIAQLVQIKVFKLDE